MLRSLVGSEMCIRDSIYAAPLEQALGFDFRGHKDGQVGDQTAYIFPVSRCLLYTSDAADDLLCVDLGGRRIIKKKKNKPQSIELHNN